jgi:signal transduction histidine kinase
MANNDLVFSNELREQIVSSFERHLRAQASTILDRSGVRDQMVDQARSILDEVVDSSRGTAKDVDYPVMPLSAEIGVIEAIEGSLLAAGTFFETALPLVQRAFAAAGWSEVDVALVMHRVIMSRIASCTVSHAELRLKAIRDSHRAQEARLARNLHDSAAHAIGVAIQNLQLYKVYASQEPARAQEKLHHAQQAMKQALDTVREFAAELRIAVRPDRLQEMLTKYLTTNTENHVKTSVTVIGDPTVLPKDLCEEIYVTLREAMRNALVHSGASRLDVSIEISASHLLAQVSDTGRGFSVENVKQTGQGLGLSSMQERVQLLGGTLRLSSLLGHGTTVNISIPLSKVVQ